MKRCVGNLVANAQRHAERVRVSATREAQFVSIVVDDDGAGIDPAYREDVFRPFYRLDEARNQDEGGSGLGLAIARDIARSHGGDITLPKVRWEGSGRRCVFPFSSSAQGQELKPKR